MIATDGCGPMTGASRGYHDEKHPTMTFPHDQVVAIAGANSQLALRFFDIARTTGARQAEIEAQPRGPFLEPGTFSEVGSQELREGKICSGPFRMRWTLDTTTQT